MGTADWPQHSREAGLPNIRKHFRGSLSMAIRPSGFGRSSSFDVSPHAAPRRKQRLSVGNRGNRLLGELQRINPQADRRIQIQIKIIKAEVLRDRGTITL